MNSAKTKTDIMKVMGENGKFLHVIYLYKLAADLIFSYITKRFRHRQLLMTQLDIKEKLYMSLWAIMMKSLGK